MIPKTFRRLCEALAVSAALMLPATAAIAAAPCGTGNFDSWLTGLKSEAASKGISQQAIAAGLTGVTMDQSVLNRDHSQKVFGQTFEQFSGRMVPPRMQPRLQHAQAVRFGAVAHRTAYGVPARSLSRSGIRRPISASTSANSRRCVRSQRSPTMRRADEFRAELLDGLRIVDRGDLAACRTCAAPGPANSGRPSSCPRPG